MLKRTAVLILCCATSAAAQSTDPAWDSAYFAWDEGRYDEALARMQHLVTNQPTRYHERVALLTGELYSTTEIAPDGRAPRWSADARYALYETGGGAARETHIVQVQDGRATRVRSVTGYGAVFTLNGLAFFALTDTPELQGARNELARLSGAAAARKRTQIAQLEARAARLVLLNFASGSTREVSLPAGTAKQSLAASQADVLLAAAAVNDTVTQIYRITADGTVVRLTTGDRSKEDLLAIPGARVLFSGGQRQFGIMNPDGSVRTFEGSTPSVSADGSTLVYTGRDDNENTINVLTLSTGAAAVVKRTTLPLANATLSPDGSRIVYQSMPREDWELFVIDRDGSDERRLTREIQHDLLPRFLNDTIVLAVMGEARHRRSHLYSVNTGVRTRLFHNNTVRTVAPEYTWAPSPDGRYVLIVADRDGNTISPERGLYLVDLGRKVSPAELAQRISASLAAERDLRERGRRLFASTMSDIRAAVSDVSTARIYDYARDLFQLDSKFITQPGNRLAIDYLERKLREFGYEPELQWFEPRPGVRTANVIATLRGTVHPELIYVVSSHFDSVERGPGADDNSSGTTALLEAARVLAKRPQAATIKFAFFTGEEAGLLGSREFVRRAVANQDRIVGALNNDMIGWANDHRMDNTIRYSNDGIRDLQHAAAFLFTNLITYDSRYYQNTDAHAYYEAYGDIVGGIGSHPILGNPHYHQVHDVLETINQQLVAEVSKTTAASIMQLASSPARLKGLQASGSEVRWTVAPEKDVIAYIVSYGPAANPAQTVARVNQPSAQLRDLQPGMVVRVKAVNRRGLESWDWAVIGVGS